MKKKIIKEIVNIISRNGYVVFYLHNVRYAIIKKDNEFIIRQSGCDNIIRFNDIVGLFQNYCVYGESLIESLDDIIIS